MFSGPENGFRNTAGGNCTTFDLSDPVLTLYNTWLSQSRKPCFSPPPNPRPRAGAKRKLGWEKAAKPPSPTPNPIFKKAMLYNNLMIELNIPGRGIIEIEYLVCDV